MTRRETDPTLRRIERDAWVVCLVLTLAGLAVSGGRIDVAGGVLAGGVLVAASYRAIKGGVDAVASAGAGRREAGHDGVSARQRRRTMARGALAFVGRYALLALLAYVMIARLHVHPIGLLAGASSVVVATAVEAVRLLRSAGRAS